MPNKMKGKKKGPAYEGSLSQRIPVQNIEPPTVLGAVGGSTADKIDSVSANLHIPVEWLVKMSELLSHYKIDRNNPDRWFSLSLSLAIDHVPGFQLDDQKKGGAPLDWDGRTLARLNFEVSGLMAKNIGMSIKAACETILSDPARCRAYPIGTGGRPVSVATLMRRYHASGSDPLVGMLQRIAAQSETLQKIVTDEFIGPP